MAKLSKTRYYSWCAGKLAKGCQHCVKGEKLVLFVTGICPKNCYFCPISDKKYDRDDVYANEWKIASKKNIIEEAKLCDSKGAGFTGGDPLSKLDRTLSYINMLKEEFGKKFHIHLYTPLEKVTRIKLRKLHSAGLDEIRLHPDLDNKKDWRKIAFAGLFKWSKGIEIPAIPGKEEQTKELIDFCKGKVDFININELEMADSSVNKLAEMGFKPKSRTSYAVKGSEELAKKMAGYAAKKRINVHYCSAKLKDAVQLRKRIARRAKNVALPYDTISKDGTLIRGIIYLSVLKPGVDYNIAFEKVNQKRMQKRLFKIKKQLQRELNFKFNELAVDKEKLRIITGVDKVKKYKKELKKMNLVPAIVEEYPTYDALEVEIDFL